MKLWRISKFLELNGAGGLQVPGRWHSAGQRIVYTADHSALAVLEIFVHLERRRVPSPYQLLEIQAADDIPLREFGSAASPSIEESRAWGDDWLSLRETAIAKVPSAIAPKCFNYLINPSHPDAAEIELVAHGHYPWDARLFG